MMRVCELAPVDCDIHIPPPTMPSLLPYLSDYWSDMVVMRGVDRLDPGSRHGLPSTSFSGDATQLCRAALDPWNTRYAIGHCLHAAPGVFSEDMGNVLVSAVNDWVAQEWLARDARLRASILVHTENPQRAVEEIERRADDNRFVQVLMPLLDRMPLGKRHYWPIYEAAERHGLAIGVHAGSLYHHAPSPIGWPSSMVEEYSGQSIGFQSQLLSFIAEGVFAKFPGLKVVLLESGVTWLPAFMWRAVKEWRAMRIEVPWVDRPPDEIVREHVRVSVQPLDAPPDDERLLRVIDQIASDDVLLFSTNFPHHDAMEHGPLPAAFGDALVERICVHNPLAAFPCLQRAEMEEVR